jgi:phosphoglycolate phosphatase-like HAD superfamily hydrolase
MSKLTPRKFAVGVLRRAIRSSNTAVRQRRADHEHDDVAAIGGFEHDFGIVSSNRHVTVELILEFCEFADWFDTYYGREMGVESSDRKKPHLHYLERTLADLGADSALYVGDSESDVEPARRVGLDSAFVRRDHCEGVELSVEPTYEVRDLHDLVENATTIGSS